MDMIRNMKNINGKYDEIVLFAAVAWTLMDSDDDKERVVTHLTNTDSNDITSKRSS